MMSMLSLWFSVLKSSEPLLAIVRGSFPDPPSSCRCVIADGQRAAVLVRLDMDLQIVLRDADGGIGQAFEIALVAGVRRVGDQLTQEDLAVCIDRIDHQVKQLLLSALN